MSQSDLIDLGAGAIEAATRAGAYARSMVGKHGQTRAKEAGNTLASQVVTDVDLEAQRLILETLSTMTTAFDLGILTEESADDSSRFRSDCFWCIDPLDGTLPFTEGRPGWSVSIALVSREGRPLIGVVYDPVKGETFHAVRGEGVFKNGTPIPPDEEDETGGPLTWIIDRSMKGLSDYPALVAEMEQLASQGSATDLNIIDYAGAALNGTWVMGNAPAVYFKLPKKSKGGGSIWDFAASACLLQEWGQPPTDIYGNTLNLNRSDSTFMNELGVIYASDPRLRDSVHKMFKRHTA